MCHGGGGHKWTAVKVLREPRLPLCPQKQTQLESQNQTQSETERSCRAVAVANSAWSMHRDGTTQAVQVVPKVAAGNTVAVLHKCPSRRVPIPVAVPVAVASQRRWLLVS